MKPLIVIPTYNERENLPLLIPEVLDAVPAAQVLVVDDNSPDGTGDWVAEFARSEDRVHLLSRPGKQGLGRAYVAGFQWALERGYDVVVEMDADFSHRPCDLPELLAALESGADFAVGSRYVAGGGTKNWGWLRRMISRGGGLYSRLILGFPLNDWTGGFNAWTKPVLESIGLSGITSNGYSFQIELKYKALKKGFQGREVPILFEDRRIGQSKMSLKIVIEAFYRVWLLRS